LTIHPAEFDPLPCDRIPPISFGSHGFEDGLQRRRELLGLPAERRRARLERRAARELRYLHRSALAGLLRQAALLRARREEVACLFSPPETPISCALLRDRLERTLHLCALDRLELPHRESLELLRKGPVEDWPDPVLLAEQAIGLRDSEAARLVLAHALLVRRQARRAVELLSVLLRSGAPLGQRWRALEGLAAAHAWLGHHRLAMASMDAAADEPGCGVDALVSGLYLVLRARGTERLQRAAARLDILVDPFEPAFRSALARLRDWVSWEQRRSGRTPACGAGRGLISKEASPTGRVLRLLARSDSSS
jgi:hypothetical protein